MNLEKADLLPLKVVAWKMGTRSATTQLHLQSNFGIKAAKNVMSVIDLGQVGIIILYYIMMIVCQQKSQLWFSAVLFKSSLCEDNLCNCIPAGTCS